MGLVLVLDNVRSAYNVGALWRTAEGAGVERLILIGQTPHPACTDDPRPPYVADRAAKLIAKTALGAEAMVPFIYYPDVAAAITQLQHNHYKIIALELADQAADLFAYEPPEHLALIVGHEVDGLGAATIAACDAVLQLPMAGRKESLNVATAAGIAMYQLKFGRSQAASSES